jgi:hypothetical protein
MVTGKNKEQFEKWFKKSSMYEEYIFLTQIDVSFNDLPFEMQIGVYLAYYDHKEILINVTSFTRCVIIAMSYERSCYFIGLLVMLITILHQKSAQEMKHTKQHLKRQMN